MIRTAADWSSRVVAASTKTFLVLELVEVSGAVDRSWSVAERLGITTRPMSYSALHLYHALSNTHC